MIYTFQFSVTLGPLLLHSDLPDNWQQMRTNIRIVLAEDEIDD